MANQVKPKAVIGEVRFSYAHVFKPFGDTDPKYSVVAVIDKRDRAIYDLLMEKIQEVYESERNGMFKGKRIEQLSLPLKDGDEQDTNAVYHGCWYIGSNRKTPPGLIDRNKQPIINQDDFYSGCYGYISMNIAPYSVNGKTGIKAYLNHIMKTRDGERLDGATTAEFDFANIDLGGNADELF